MAGLSRAVRSAIEASREPSRRAIVDWRASPAYRRMAQAFADCPLQSPEPAAERAEELLSDGDWAADLLAPLLRALAADPFFEPPFKVSRDPLRIGAILFDCPALSIAASVTSAAAMAVLPPPESIIFTGRMAVTRTVRAGRATLRRWRTEAPGPAFNAATAPPAVEIASARPRDGDLHRIDGRCEAQLPSGAASDMVTITATIRAGASPLMREHAMAGGALLRVANGDDRPSRTEMLLTFLRMSGRSDAGLRFEAVTHDPAFHLRWAAMREWLALDAAAALPRLAEMAQADPNVEVRAAATLTLVACRRRLDETQCPA